MTLDWDQYFIALAKISSLRSKDPNTKVGSILVNQANRVIGLGYNGMPKGLDDRFSWDNQGQEVDTKYPYVVHAEINAILNSIKNVENANLYTSLFPCSNCAKFIAQSGIKEVIYGDDKYQNTLDNQIAKDIFKKTNVKFRILKSIDLEIVQKGEQKCINIKQG